MQPSDSILNPTEAELAAAIALDCAEAGDQRLAEGLMAESSLFEQQVAEDQQVAAELAYTAPLQPLNPNLKSRLFDHLGLVSPGEEPDILDYLAWSIEALEQRSQTLNWVKMPSLPEVVIATLSENFETRTTAFFVKTDAAVTFPLHEHAEGEVIRVIRGDFVVEDNVYTAGSRLDSEAGTAHQPKTHSGCLIFCISSMDDKYVDAITH